MPLERRWQPYELNPDMGPGGIDRFAYPATKFGGAERARQVYSVIEETAERDGLPIRLDRIKRTPNTLNAHRLVRFASRLNLADKLTDLLFAAYFVESLDIGDREVLLAKAAEAGIDPDLARDHLGGNADIAAIRLPNRLPGNWASRLFPASSSTAAMRWPERRSLPPFCRCWIWRRRKSLPCPSGSCDQLSQILHQPVDALHPRRGVVPGAGIDQLVVGTQLHRPHLAADEITSLSGLANVLLWNDNTAPFGPASTRSTPAVRQSCLIVMTSSRFSTSSGRGRNGRSVRLRNYRSPPVHQFRNAPV